MLFVDRPPYDHAVVDREDASLVKVALSLGRRICEQQPEARVALQGDAAAVDQIVVGQIQQGGVELAVEEHSADALIARDAVEAQPGGWFEARRTTVTAFLSSLHPPLEIFWLDAELVFEDAARPQRGGLLVLRHADTLALEVLRLVDAAIGAHPGAGMEEAPRGEDWQADPVAVALGHRHEQG